MKRKCKVCQSTNFINHGYNNHCNKRKFKRIKYHLVNILSPFLKCISLEIDSKLLFSPLYKIVRCASCGYAIHEKQISSDILKKYYHNLYWNSGGFSDNENAQSSAAFLEDHRAQGQYSIIKNHLSFSSRVKTLEVGAGSALLSRLIRHHHPETNIEVVESGQGWDKYYRALNIKKVADFFPFSSNKQYHCILTSHWLEHVSTNIEEVLNNLNKLLLPGGLLFIEVPNCNDLYWELDVGDMPHIHFFTEDSLKRIFTNFGFELISTGCYGYTTQEFKDFIHPDSKTRDPRKELKIEATNSIQNSVPREDGNCLRALFKKRDDHLS